jgi:hypothetical protein
MSISGVGNGADLMGIMSQVAQGTTAQDASMNVLKKALDASASTASDLASLVSEVTAAGSQLNVYA